MYLVLRKFFFLHNEKYVNAKIKKISLEILSKVLRLYEQTFYIRNTPISKQTRVTSKEKMKVNKFFFFYLQEGLNLKNCLMIFQTNWLSVNLFLKS